MLDEHTAQALSMFALSAIGEDDICDLLGREEFFLTEEESTFVENLRNDYDAWLVEQMLIEEELLNSQNNQLCQE